MLETDRRCLLLEQCHQGQVMFGLTGATLTEVEDMCGKMDIGQHQGHTEHGCRATGAKGRVVGYG